MREGKEREELHKMLEMEDLCQRKSSLDPAVKEIAYAMLVQAIRDLQSDDNSKQAKGWKADAVEWFANEGDEIGSFVWVCTILGWDPGRTRAGVKSLRIRQQRAKVVH